MTKRATTTPQDWVNDVERRIAAQQRRRHITSAADLLGPGIASKATRVVDWNDETMDFNGIYCSDTGSLNSPDAGKRWIGTSFVDEAGNGIQILSVYVDSAAALATWTPSRKVRAFVVPDGSTRVFSTWQTG